MKFPPAMTQAQVLQWCLDNGMRLVATLNGSYAVVRVV